MEEIQNRIEPNVVNNNKSMSSVPLKESGFSKLTKSSLIQHKTCNIEKLRHPKTELEKKET